jgi:hypothetical protein
MSALDNWKANNCNNNEFWTTRDGGKCDACITGKRPKADKSGCEDDPNAAASAAAEEIPPEQSMSVSEKSDSDASENSDAAAQNADAITDSGSAEAVIEQEFLQKMDELTKRFNDKILQLQKTAED